MKSVVVEASTVAKAIETAWLKAEKPEEFFIRVLQEHTSGFLGFGAQKAKIVFFFKNTHKSDSLFPVVVKQKEYSSFFGNSNLKVPAQLNFVDVDLNKNAILNPVHKKKPHNNQSNQQKPKQNNNVPVRAKPTENQVVNKPVLHKVFHVDKNVQGQAVKQIKNQHPLKSSHATNPVTVKPSLDKAADRLGGEASEKNVAAPKMQVSLQAPVVAKQPVVQKNVAQQVDKKEDIVQDVTKILKKIQTQKIIANVSRPVHKTMPKQVVAKFESYEDFINSTTGIPAEKIVTTPQVSSFVKVVQPTNFSSVKTMADEKTSDFVNTSINAAADKQAVVQEELVVAVPQVTMIAPQAKVNVTTTPRVPLKLKRRPLATDNPGVSGITRSSDKKNSDSLSDIAKNDDVKTDDKE